MTTENLEKILMEITGGDTIVTGNALLTLSDAVNTYRSSQYIVDGENIRSKPGIAEDRKAMKKLRDRLGETHDALAALSIGCTIAFADAYGWPKGRLSQEIEEARAAVDKALRKLQLQPDKVADPAKRILSLQVTLVFRDILKITPTATRDRAENITFSRGGAAFARVLRAVLTVAGHPNVDIGPLIDDGLALLSDQELPHNLQ